MHLTTKFVGSAIVKDEALDCATIQKQSYVKALRMMSFSVFKGFKKELAPLLKAVMVCASSNLEDEKPANFIYRLAAPRNRISFTKEITNPEHKEKRMRTLHRWMTSQHVHHDACKRPYVCLARLREPIFIAPMAPCSNCFFGASKPFICKNFPP